MTKSSFQAILQILDWEISISQTFNSVNQKFRIKNNNLLWFYQISIKRQRF